MTESRRLADQKRRIDMYYGELFAATLLLKAIAGRLKGIKSKESDDVYVALEYVQKAMNSIVETKPGEYAHYCSQMKALSFGRRVIR
jgi:hypothetical protein